MKSTGIVRKVDELGRIVLPIELRRSLNIDVKDSLEIFVDEEKIVLKKYIDTILKKYDNPRKDCCIITHSKMDEKLAKEIIEYVKSKNIFNRIEESIAGSVITSHCGPGTLGILYINDGKF